MQLGSACGSNDGEGSPFLAMCLQGEQGVIPASLVFVMGRCIP